ncbi:MAG: hypothetical protein EOP46_14350 [Sphingobacteriaceae bacterium]|nr:MAG: hypothetical protein EOP46_14350 [Sphingobacteriaceae bacterium]
MRVAFFYAVLIYGLYAGGAYAQSFESALLKATDSLLAPVKTNTELLPNSVLQNLISPSGWGGYGTYVFGGIGGDNPQPYGSKADLISFAGFCIGNPEKAVNVAVSVNATDVSGTGNFSGNMVVSRRIFTGSSISAGAMQLFADRQISDAPGSTFYVAFSHAIQSLPNDDGSAKLTYSLGIGTGRFYNKSPFDIAAGRGKHGTAVFGGVSYQLIKWMNFNVEWSGMNLGTSVGIKPFKSPLAIGVGLTNLTRYTNDRINTSFVVCYPLALRR